MHNRPEPHATSTSFLAEDRKMMTTPKLDRVPYLRRSIPAILGVGLAVMMACSPRVLAANSQQQSFPSPEAATQALIAALKSSGDKALLKVLGADAKRLIDSGDATESKTTRENFVRRYEEANTLIKSGDAQAVLQIGKDEWPFPIPLVKVKDSWHFDTAAGQQEIIDRRIGRHELAAIQVCLAYVDAQHEYYARNPEKAGLLHYAQKGASSPGKRDGLYWNAAADETPSPLGSLFAKARTEGYAGKGIKGSPYHGYYYRILTAQGPDAAGGAYDYLAHGKMIGGFALVASPAKYDSSGVMTFIVNQDGVVFQKDLGPKTAAIATAMKTFNPDSTWKPVENAGAAEK